MKYEKLPISFEAQADQLLARGLAADRAELIRRLEAVNYYRLSGYLHPFRQRIETPGPGAEVMVTVSDDFKPGTTLELVWERYTFDRRFRLLLMDAIERIEVSVRTRIVQDFSRKHGPFGHLLPQNLPNLKVEDYLKWRTKLAGNAVRSQEKFAKHFFEKYGDEHPELPLWMLCELMDFGGMQTFYRGMEHDMRQQVARTFGLADELLDSWLRALNTVRNACAHHSRVWNRVWGTPVKLPARNKFPDWHRVWDEAGKAWNVPARKAAGGTAFDQDRTGVVMTICHYWLGLVAHTSQWRSRVFALFDEYPRVPLPSMGLPEQWREHPLWKDKA